MISPMLQRLRGALGRFISTGDGSATEYIIIAGLAVIILGAAVSAWNEGLQTYLEELLTDLQALGT